jgi:hypothetical protein
MTDQRTVDIAVAQAATKAAAQHAAKHKASGIPHKKSGSDLITALGVGFVLLATLALAIFMQK